MIGWVVPDTELRASPPPRPSGNIRVYSINYKEELETNIYNPDGSYSVEAAKQIAHVFRCRRTGEEHEIDPRLLTILSHVNDRFGGQPLELLSGYRFQRKTTSNHFHGTAADIRIAGVRVRDLRPLSKPGRRRNGGGFVSAGEVHPRGRAPGAQLPLD